MPPEKIIKHVVGRLMAAYHECHLFESIKADLSTVMFYSSKHNQFGLDGCWRATFKELAARCNRWLDLYPFHEFQQFLQTAVADAKETAACGAETSAFFRKALEGFFK